MPETGQDIRGLLGVPWNGKFLRIIPITQQWIIHDLLPPLGRFMVAAPAKTGKSLFVLQLAHSVAAGVPFLGFAVDSGPLRVHYIDWEMGPVFMQNRMNGMADVYPGADENIFITMFPASGVEAAMQSVPNIGLFIIDPIISTGYTDENNASEIRRHLNRIHDIARSQNAAVLIVHHSRKESKDRTQANQGLGEARGSSAFVDWIDGGIALRHVKGGHDYVLDFKMRGAAEHEPLTIQRDPETLVYTVEGSPLDTADIIAKVAADWQHEQHTMELPPTGEFVKRVQQKTGYGRSKVYELLRQLGYTGRTS